MRSYNVKSLSRCSVAVQWASARRPPVVLAASRLRVQVLVVSRCPCPTSRRGTNRLFILQRRGTDRHIITSAAVALVECWCSRRSRCDTARRRLELSTCTPCTQDARVTTRRLNARTKWQTWTELNWNWTDTCQCSSVHVCRFAHSFARSCFYQWNILAYSNVLTWSICTVLMFVVLLAPSLYKRTSLDAFRHCFTSCMLGCSF